MGGTTAKLSLIAGGRPQTTGEFELHRIRLQPGSGIPADLLPHVFDRFARGATSTGSGLGLSIARGLVELHGGTIAAASPPGGGAEIRIVLPSDAGPA